MERPPNNNGETPSLQEPISAGIIASVVGYTSSFAVVLTGLAAVGASPKQAASGLLALCIVQSIGTFWLLSLINISEPTRPY